MTMNEYANLYQTFLNLAHAIDQLTDFPRLSPDEKCLMRHLNVFWSNDQDIKVVEILNRVFSAFDDLVLGLNVEKIKMIGDAYMAACGLFSPRADHAHAVADMALAMTHTLAVLNETLPTPHLHQDQYHPAAFAKPH